MSFDRVLKAALAAAERAEIEEYQHHITDRDEELTEEDWERERSILASERAVARSWQMEHANSILEALHHQRFGTESIASWLNDFVTKNRHAARVKHGRVTVSTDYCSTPHASGYREAAGPMLQNACSRLAMSHVLKSVRSGHLPQWFRDRAANLKSDPMSENSNLYVMSHIELAAACLLEMDGGVKLAERYYQEVHGLSVSLERSGFHHGNFGEPINEYAASWDISFDLGAVDEASYQRRVEDGKKRVVREALLEGPRRKRAKGERNIALALLERRLGLIAKPVLARIAEFLCVEDGISQSAFK
jgi:hypothetical protein